MGVSAEELELERLRKEREVTEAEDNRLEGLFIKLYKDLAEIAQTAPSRLYIRNGPCGLPFYAGGPLLCTNCPVCNAGVQKFIENKLIKIMNIGNKIYPVYSTKSCINASIKNKEIVNDIYKYGPLCQTDENGKKYFEIAGKKLYCPSYVPDRVSFFFKESKDKFSLTRALDLIVPYRNKDTILYDTSPSTYYYKNPLRNFSPEKTLIIFKCTLCQLEYHAIKNTLLCYFDIYEEQERKKQEEAEKIAKEEAEKLAKEEAEKLAKEEEEKLEIKEENQINEMQEAKLDKK